MNKTLKITTVLISSIFLITSCVSNDQHTHTPQYDWERLRAISKITNNHNQRRFVITETCNDEADCTLEPIPSMIKISPTINDLDLPDINISLVEKSNSDYPDTTVELPRRKQTDISTSREHTEVTYYFVIEECEFTLDMNISRPVWRKGGLTKEFTFILSGQQTLQCIEYYKNNDKFNSFHQGSPLATSGRGRD